MVVKFDVELADPPVDPAELEQALADAAGSLPFGATEISFTAGIWEGTPLIVILSQPISCIIKAIALL